MFVKLYALDGLFCLLMTMKLKCRESTGVEIGIDERLAIQQNGRGGRSFSFLFLPLVCSYMKYL